MEWVVVLAGLIHLICTPYTKVEESFNIQAVHDILFYRLNITQYDHLEFPGVVPRTFIGPLILAFLSAPFVFLSEILHIGTKFTAQYIVRTVLCLSVTLSLLLFSRSLRSNLGKSFSWWYLVVSASQYHLLYYCSRPLPNILALPLTLLALHALLTPKGTKWFLICSGCAIVWFRAELGLLLGIILLIQVIDKKVKPLEVLQFSVPVGVALVVSTLLIDSIFWRRLVWPEAEVFYFNAILNKSSDWGTSPFFWYFYSAVPRGLATSCLFIPLGLAWEPRVRRIVLAAFLFILCFSFLPHKELRFIIYTFPLLNTAVAAACHRLWQNRLKSKFQFLLGLAVAGHVAANVIFTLFLLMVARVNYPGGVAISRLHQLIPHDVNVYVHIDNLAAQTGVSRFTQLNDNWRYSKIENLTRGSLRSLQFTHLIVEAKSKYSANLKPYLKTHRILESVEGFSEIAINNQLIPPIRIKTKPLLFILERKQNIIVPDIVPSAEDFRTPIYSEEDVTPEGLTEEDMSEEEEEALIEETTEVTSSNENEEINDSGEQTNEEKYDDDDLLAMESRETEPSVLEEQDEDEPEVEEVSNEIINDEPASLEHTVKQSEETEDEDVSDDINNEEPASLEHIFKQLEERFNSGEEGGEQSSLDNILLEDDVLNDIKMLSGVEFDTDAPEMEKLKEAFKSILKNYKEHVLKNESTSFPNVDSTIKDKETDHFDASSETTKQSREQGHDNNGDVEKNKVTSGETLGNYEANVGTPTKNDDVVMDNDEEDDYDQIEDSKGWFDSIR